MYLQRKKQHCIFIVSFLKIQFFLLILSPIWPCAILCAGAILCAPTVQYIHSNSLCTAIHPCCRSPSQFYSLLAAVCLSSRLQQGYNGVERAEFQRREQQLRSSSVLFSARLRGSRALHIGETLITEPAQTGDRLHNLQNPTRPPLESASLVTKS